jgi:hydroxymethylpyrimidine pyrophosphatase-like HAD family hydrolase
MNGSLELANLLNDLDGLGALLEQAARERNALDAFLLAAGINQIAEDYLHDSPFPLEQAASMFGRFDSTAGRVAARLAVGTGLAIRTVQGRRPAARRALAWERQMGSLVDQLAEALLAGGDAPGPILDRCRQLALQIPSQPGDMRQAVVRLPNCFHGFDQRPEDLERLAVRFTDRWPDRERSLLVVGLRTSGSYMAPLIAAALRARGYARVRAITIRPGRALLVHERALVRSVVRAGGQVLLTDDPPVTGSSLATAAAQLGRFGVTPGMVVLLLGIEHESARLPAPLRSYETVILPQRDWNVEARFSPDRVRSALAELLDGELEPQSLETVPLPGRARTRGHRRALFCVSGIDPADRSPRRLDVLAVGTGLGYFGDHELAVARALSAFAPRVLGLHDGVLYREWLPPGRRLHAESGQFAGAVASYVAARRRALRVGRDMSAAMQGQRPVWEVAALMLARGFAPAASVMRILLVNRAVGRLVRVSQPSVVDGNMTSEHWFCCEGGRRVVKVGLSDRTYWRLGLACFDASFDLAGAGTVSCDGELAEQMRAAWRAETGEEVDGERWLLYELAHLWGLLQEDRAREAEVRHASARAAARYFARSFLGDLKPAAGPLCALDIDGVLETSEVGFPTLTRASATALRALLAHGYQPVVVTGRGIDEVRDRCRIYGLQAGVAEYGSAIWVQRDERATRLIDRDTAAALDRLRAILEQREGVQLDPAFKHAVRAYCVRADGQRRPLDAAEVGECLEAAAAAGAVRAIPGYSQTDFAPVAVDKGTGLRALARVLQADDHGCSTDGLEIALAVGDTAADAPMLALASAAFTPAHAVPAATRTGARRLGRPYQAGLYVAVGELLGHEPGSCPCCRVPPPTRERDLLLDLLSVTEDGHSRLPLKALRLAWKLR